MIQKLIAEWWSQALSVIFGVLYINSWVQTQRTDNLTKIRKLYNGLIDDLKGKLMEVDELKTKIDELQHEIRLLRKENQELKIELQRKNKDV